MAQTQGRRASIKDVAARAGVSSKTVSNVLHDHPYVRGETRARVERAIRALGYRPDLNARNLRRGRSGVLALAVPELAVPYFAELASHIVQAARERGYTVLVDETAGDAERELELITGLGPRLADAVLCSPSGLNRTQLDALGNLDQAPLVLLGESNLEHRLDHVLIDNVGAAEEVTGHLADLGRDRIAAVGVHPGATDDLRLEGYRRALAARDLEADPRLVVEVGGGRRPDGGARAIRELLAAGAAPDAVFCFTDLLAIGAIRALHEAGLTVPGDVAVAGFDDIDQTRHAVPSLTTIAPDKTALARTAVDLALTRLDSPDAPPRQLTIAHRLEVRESTVAEAEAFDPAITTS